MESDKEKSQSTNNQKILDELSHQQQIVHKNIEKIKKTIIVLKNALKSLFNEKPVDDNFQKKMRQAHRLQSLRQKIRYKEQELAENETYLFAIENKLNSVDNATKSEIKDSDDMMAYESLMKVLRKKHAIEKEQLEEENKQKIKRSISLSLADGKVREKIPMDQRSKQSSSSDGLIKKSQELIKDTMGSLQESGLKTMISEPIKRSDRKAQLDEMDYISDIKKAVLSEKSPMSLLLLYAIIFFFIIAILWAKITVLEETTTGSGKVIPSSQIQAIQNLEGGILDEMYVHEGDHVKRGQILLRIDDTRFSSTYNEGQQKYLALEANIARLRAEAKGLNEITFPEVVKNEAPEMIENELKLFKKQKEQLASIKATLEKSYKLSKEELDITAPLVKEGIISQIELLRLKRQTNELKGDIDKAEEEFRSTSQKELNEKEAELASLKETLVAAADRVKRTVIRSPVSGIVNLVEVSTKGAVIKPGMNILEIVPTDDKLLIEAKIKPQDIAFISPGQRAVVKVTAYDFSLYGGLESKVKHISADTIEETENGRKVSYYKILVQTDKSFLGRKDNPLYIIPGMTVSVDIMTGKKSVLDYLLKPILKAKHSAFRER